MSPLANSFALHLSQLNLSHPLVLIDLVFALFFITISLMFIHRYPVFRVVLGVLFLFCWTYLFLLGGFLFTAAVFGLATITVTVGLPSIFAPDIRHYLEKLGRLSFLRIPHITDRQKKIFFIRNVVDAVFELAERRVGATIVFVRKTGLGNTIETGVTLDAKFSSKLLQNIFFNKTPLHDGAVIIQGERIVAAKCLLPISTEIKLDPPLGTRHKSGLAITTDTDAVVIIISEQRGEVSLAENGKLQLNLDRTQLITNLLKLL